MLSALNKPSASENLDLLASLIRDEHGAVGLAARDMLQHAMAAGDALIKARDQAPNDGWECWVKQRCDLSMRSAQIYMQLARHRVALQAEAQSSAPLSIAAALRYLKDAGNPAQARKTTKKKAMPPALSVLAWSDAPLEKRRYFLDGIGLLSLLEAIPAKWRTEIERRVAGHRNASTASCSPLEAQIVKSLKLALSTKTGAESLAALGAIQRLLNRNGFDLHDIEILVRPAPKSKRAAADQDYGQPPA